MYVYAEHSELGFVCESAAATVLKNIILEDVYVTPSCAGDSSDDRAGGLLGCVKAAGTTIDNCVVVGAVGVSPLGAFCEHFGGLIGGCDAAPDQVTNCLIVARVTATQSFGIIVTPSKDKISAEDKATIVTYDAANE